MAKKVKLTSRSPVASDHYKDLVDGGVDPSANLIYWEIDAAEPGQDWFEAVEEILASIEYEVTKAVLDANAPTRVTLSRASKRC